MNTYITLLATLFFSFYSCHDSSPDKEQSTEYKVVFLHHSTGNNIWNGGVSEWFENYNRNNINKFIVREQDFPKQKPYGWKNYPYDYYNIWVKNEGERVFMEEPTLEILTKEYDLIIWKHCYPVSAILEDTGNPNINSEEKRVENYKLQYIALKEKMRAFPNTKFLIWTGATHVRNKTTEEKAKRMREFVKWVKNDWNENNDNIFIWDFYELETEGGLYLKDEYALNKDNSHPNEAFSQKAAPLFAKKIVDIFQ